MRNWKLMTCLVLALSLVIAAVAEPIGQRGQRGQRGPASVDEEEILENFDRIVEAIWTEGEEDEWDRLRSDEEKQSFINAFWEGRDPTPGTPDNEFRDIYMGRVATAVTTFGNEGIAGYRTERGKVFIIYGENALLAQEMRQGGGQMTVGGGGGENVGAGAARGPAQAFMYVWTMDTSTNPFLEGKEEIIFAPFQGSFTMSTRGVELTEEAFLANRDLQQLFVARRANPTASMSGAGTGSGSSSTPDVEAMSALIGGLEPPFTPHGEGTEQSDLALQQDFRFLSLPNGTWTAIAFEIGKEGLSFGADNVKVFGSLLREDPVEGEILVQQIDANFTLSEDEGDTDSATHTFGLMLPPGPHRLAWGVMDNVSRRLTTVSKPFNVPSLNSEELGIPSVTLIGAMGQTQEPIDDGQPLTKIYPVMRLGGFEFDIDIDRAFGRNENITLMYSITGLETDPGTGQFQAEITHRVIMPADESGEAQSLAALPTATQPSPLVQITIPLGQITNIEAGTDYIIEIQVKDLIADDELTHEVPFSVKSEGS